MSNLNLLAQSFSCEQLALKCYHQKTSIIIIIKSCPAGSSINSNASKPCVTELWLQLYLNILFLKSPESWMCLTCTNWNNQLISNNMRVKHYLYVLYYFVLFLWSNTNVYLYLLFSVKVLKPSLRLFVSY